MPSVNKKLKKSDNWGYATENYRASTPILIMNRNDAAQTFNVISNYNNTTVYLSNSSDHVASVEWTYKWTGNTTSVKVNPKNKGVSVITFTNNAYDTSFNVLVIVE